MATLRTTDEEGHPYDDATEKMGNHVEDDEEEEVDVENTPAEEFSRYISSPAGKKELIGESKIHVCKYNIIVKIYREWALKNKNASKEEVGVKMEELKAKIKELN